MIIIHKRRKNYPTTSECVSRTALFLRAVRMFIRTLPETGSFHVQVIDSYADTFYRPPVVSKRPHQQPGTYG